MVRDLEVCESVNIVTIARKSGMYMRPSGRKQPPDVQEAVWRCLIKKETMAKKKNLVRAICENI